MILCDWLIRRFCDAFGLIEFNENLLNSQSFDVTLANKFGFISPTGKVFTDSAVPVAGIDPLDKDSFTTEWVELPYLWLYPGDFVLAGTAEAVNFPTGIVGQVTGKSSLGRLGLASTVLFAGFIDGGFEAQTVVLEIVNLGPSPIKLTPGMKINQIVFHETKEPMLSYKNRGRYGGQGFSGSKGV